MAVLFAERLEVTATDDARELFDDRALPPADLDFVAEQRNGLGGETGAGMCAGWSRVVGIDDADDLGQQGLRSPADRPGSPTRPAVRGGAGRSA
jgi:hypothetical protein